MHHVAKEFARAIANLEVEARCTFEIDTEHSLVSLKEGKGAIVLKIKVQGANDRLLQADELITSHLLA